MNEIYDFFHARFFDPLFLSMLTGMVLAGVPCSLLSPLVAVKRMSLAGAGIGSSAIVGAMTGFLLFPAMTLNDWPVQLTASGSAVLAAFLYLLLNRNTIVPKESVMGIVLIGVTGLGLLAGVDWQPQFLDMTAYLLDSPQSASPVEFYILGGLTACVVLFLLVFFNPLNAICIDREYAAVLGIPTRFYEFLFVMVLTAAILLSAYFTGLLFTLTLLIFPGLCARIMVFRLKGMILFAGLSGLLSCAVSTFLSFEILDLPASIVLVMIQLPVFMILLAGNRLFARWNYRFAG